MVGNTRSSILPHIGHPPYLLAIIAERNDASWKSASFFFTDKWNHYIPLTVKGNVYAFHKYFYVQGGEKT